MRQSNTNTQLGIGTLLTAILGLSLVACDKTDRSFSLLQGQNTFQQSTSYVPRKTDILWVVDNSGSMQSSQDALTTNFSSFIQRFQSLHSDFHMAVTATDAWRAKYLHNNSLMRWRDGNGGTHSGVFVMDMMTPSLSNVFLTNANLGTSGSGDERAFESFHDSLAYAANSDFVRAGSFLSIIIISDEDDFSSTQQYHTADHDYNSPNLVPITTYQTYLDGLVGAGNYSVNAITIMDQACLTQLNASIPGRIIGQRYMDFADRTGGVKASLCGDFGNSLQLISNSIVELSSTFTLDRQPAPGSLNVVVDGVVIPENATNGWTFDSNTLTLSFHGDAVPGQGAAISITFDPLAPKN